MIGNLGFSGKGDNANVLGLIIGQRLGHHRENVVGDRWGGGGVRVGYGLISRLKAMIAQSPKSLPARIAEADAGWWRIGKNIQAGGGMAASLAAAPTGQR